MISHSHKIYTKANAYKDNPSQSLLEAAITLNVSDEEYKSLTEHARKAARDALHKVFNDYDLNLIIGPTESSMDTYAAAAGRALSSYNLRNGANVKQDIQ